MLRKLVILLLVTTLFIGSGCVNIDEPLLDLGDHDSSRPTPTGSGHDACQRRIQSLERDLARYKQKYQEKDNECDRLEDKLEDCEDKLDR